MLKAAKDLHNIVKLVYYPRLARELSYSPQFIIILHAVFFCQYDEVCTVPQCSETAPSSR